VFPEGLGGQAVEVFYEFSDDGMKRVVVGKEKGP